ncbi:AMP-binding protein [Micromonospora peucetia]|uniref:AMP-binding protein n=1 Tax=Micromonospora peucetia TaxID=47871 RepID=A0A1C6V6X4_9ACTN|nr:AMP-binding protein [Micromonospora peucetia]WSA35486.1 AMP-binding protein [Micromonospora peucetia]SCL62103.1 long-chain acyl-CoA synthetase [Micromonospora peucetia]
MAHRPCAVPDSATVQDATDSPASTLVERLHRAATAHGDRPALHWRERTLTWSELDVSVTATAHALAALTGSPSAGARPAPGGPATDRHPPRIAVALGNSPDLVVSCLAALRAGLVAVPVNPDLTAPELRHVLADSGASVLIATERVRDLVAGIAGELPALVAVHTAPPVADTGHPFPDRGGDDLALLLYTSGTEGRPKGAMLTHRALAANHEQVGRIEPPVVGPDDTVLLALPLFHAYGLNAGLGAVVHHGATGVLVDELGPDAGLAEIARRRVTVLVGVPSMVAAWSTADAAALAGATASVRVVVCGAAPLEPAVAARFTEVTGRPVHVGYGLTETAPVLTSTLVGGEPKAGSVGRPLPGVELRLVGTDGADLWRDGVAEPDDDADELDLSDGTPGTDPGQVVVRGANLFAGYWPDGRGGPDADGWWATGDVAYADSDGDLFLVDRIGELILVNGFNVYPHEVELVLSAHPGVAESAVLGVPHPRTGETVRAYVVPAPGRPVTGEELLAHCARNLARFKCPTAVEFVDGLPHSVIGKVRKTLLRPASSPASPVPSPAASPETRPPAPAGTSTTEETDA